MLLASATLFGTALVPSRENASGSGAIAGTHASYRPSTGGGLNVSLSVYQGQVESNLTVNGTGFGNGTNLTLTFWSPSLHAPYPVRPGVPCNLTANLTGNFTCSILVPALPVGTYDVNATNVTEPLTATADFTIDSPTVSVSPTHGMVGSLVVATGSGFNASTALNLTMGGETLTCFSGSQNTTTTGALNCTFRVPVLHAGASHPYLVNVTDFINTGNHSFVVDPPTLQVTPISGNVGVTTVNVTGAGYNPGATVDLSFGRAQITVCNSPGNLTAGPAGILEGCNFLVPLVSEGVEEVNASDGWNVGFANFTVGNSTISLTPTSGNVSNNVLITGTGFAPNTDLTITLGGAPIPPCSPGQILTNPSGALDCTFSVPAATAGNHAVVASDGTNPANMNFTIHSRLSLAPTSGVVGTVVTATGTGFDGVSAYSVMWNVSTTLCSGLTDPTGGFSCNTVPLPGGREGAHLISVVEGTNPATASFVITPGLVLNPSTGIAGASVQLIGTGLMGNTTYDYCFLASVTPTTHCSAAGQHFSSDRHGNVPSGTNLTVPSDAPGTYFVLISSGSSPVVNATFTLTLASVAVTPSSGTVGTTVTLTGSGFGAQVTYAYCFEPSSDVVCSGSGLATFESTVGGIVPSGVTLTIPEDPVASYYVDVSIGSSFVAGAEFNLLPNVVLALESGMVGSTVGASGTGFDASASYTLVWDVTTQLCAGETDLTGDFSCSFDVPFGVSGLHSIVAIEQSNQFDSGFTVLPSAVLTPTSGPVGDMITISGDGFSSSGTVTATWASSPMLCSSSPNSTGSFSCSFAVPAGPAGAHNVTATQSSNVATASFHVTPSFSLSPTSGAVGTSVTVSGYGFDAMTPYTVVWQSSTTECSASTTAAGSVSCSFTVPAAPQGAYSLTVREGTYTPTATFTIGASLLITPSTGVVGTFANATGSGFDADLPYTVSWNTGTALCAGITSPAGGFSCQFVIPNGPGGAHTVTVVEGSNTATVVMTATPYLVLSLASGTVGSIVTASGDGFGSQSPYSLTWNTSTTLCTGTTTTSGGFACTFTIPVAPGGATTLTATGNGYAPTATITVTPSLSLNPVAGPVGSTVTASGNGFGAGVTYVVSWNSTTTLCAGTTNSNGGFSCSFTVPASNSGAYTISVGGVAGSSSGGFTITPSVLPPPPPTPFPWWEVGVAAFIVVALLIIGLITVLRRGAPATRPKGKTLQSWDEAGGGSPSPGKAPEGAAMAAALPGTAPSSEVATPVTAETPAPEPVQDIDVLIERLEQMSLDMFKKTPKQLSQETPEDEKH
ncbi:MAG: hypothetical protein ACLPZM_01120 [Thermoplasmata archaeon]